MDDLPDLEDGPERATRVSGGLFIVLGAVLLLGGAIAPGLVGEIVGVPGGAGSQPPRDRRSAA